MKESCKKRKGLRWDWVSRMNEVYVKRRFCITIYPTPRLYRMLGINDDFYNAKIITSRLELRFVILKSKVEKEGSGKCKRKNEFRSWLKSELAGAQNDEIIQKVLTQALQVIVLFYSVHRTNKFIFSGHTRRFWFYEVALVFHDEKMSRKAFLESSFSWW